MIDHISLDVEFIQGPHFAPFSDTPSDKTQCMIKLQLFLNSKHCDTFIGYDILNYKKESWITDYPDGPQYPTFYPFSCDCDEPGCNGFHTGVTIEFLPEYIVWNFDSSEKKAINIAGKQNFIFSKQQYYQDIQKIIDKIVQESSKWDSELFLVNNFLTWDKVYSYFKE